MSFMVGRTKVELSFFFFLLVALFLLWEPSGVAGLFFGALVLHEGGHILAASAFRLPIARLRLTPLTVGLTLAPGARLTPAREFFLALGGVLANLLAAALFLIPGGDFPGGDFCLRLSATNAALGLFHLLPLSGLDGGTALTVLLTALFGTGRGLLLARIVMFFCGLLGLAGSLFVILGGGPKLAPALAAILFAWGMFSPGAE